MFALGYGAWRPAYLFSLFLLLSLPASAQTGSIIGVIVDGESGETLVGANAILEGTTVGAMSDLNGRYEIPAVPPGSYTVVFSYIGYANRLIQNVEVVAGERVRIDVRLSPEAVGLQEVVVEAAAVRNAEAALLRERQKAAAVSDAISAEVISRTGSASAADAMRRVTGASLVEGKYVLVRGLGDRYTSTQLNGATLPSADPDRNAVPLDLFPAALLDNIVTAKTFTPDRPGNFTGGAVDIGTKTFPEEFSLSFSSSAGYNSQTIGASPFLTYRTGATDWLGFDDGTRAIATGWKSPGAASPNHVQARRDPAVAHELDRLSRAFNADMAPRTGAGGIDQSYGFSAGNQVSLGGVPLGVLASVSYDRDFRSYEGGRSATYLLTGKVSEVDELSLQQDLLDTRSTSNVLWGGLATVSLRVHPNHALSSTLMYNRGAASEARYLVGPVPRNFAPERRLESRVLSFTERAVSSIQLRGDHAVPALRGLRTDWSAARVRTLQDEPDVRFFANDFTVYDRNGSVDTSYAIAVSNYTAPTRYFRSLAEDGWDAGLNASLPIRTAGMSVLLKTGGALNIRTRDFDERRFEYVLRTPYSGDPASFFSSVGIIDSTVTPTGISYQIGNYIVDASSPRNSYAGTQDVFAGYVMIEVRPVGRLRAITGIRFEHTRMDVRSRDTSIPSTNIRECDWLPSLNLVYEIGRSNLRAAYGKTLARPTFRELAPFTSFAFINAPTLSGNPGLKRTLVHNFDLRWEWFVRPGEIVAVSGFYKRFIDPIERTILNNNFETRFENVDDADVAGIELELRTRLDAGPLPLRGFEVGGNVTLAYSRVDVPHAELAQIRALDPEAGATRPLQGQSPIVVNADLTYASPATTLTLLYNVFGRRLSEVSLGGTPGIYELPFHAVDVIATRQVMQRLQLRASVRNLLGAEVRRAYPFKGQDYIAAAHSLGRSFSLSVSMSY